MAHIERRGTGRWRARYRAPDHTERSRTFATKRDAQQFLDSIEVSKAKGLWVDASLGRQRFAAYAESWIEGRGHIAPGTLQKERGHLRNYLVPAFGQFQLASIQPQDIRMWMGKIDRSPGTIRDIFATLRRILGTAVKDGVLGRNTCDAVDLPRDSVDKEMLFLTPEEVKRLAVAIDSRYQALIYLAAYGGLRWGEIAALRPGDLNMLRGTVEVRRSLSEISGHFVMQPPKSGKPRTVLIPRTISQMIGDHANAHSNTENVIFASPEGKYLRRSLWYRRFYKPAVLEAGLNPSLRFHDLRHTSVALAIAQDVHPKVIQERLGHSSIRLTLDRYGHLLPTLDEALQKGLETTFLDAAAASSRPGGANVVALDAAQRPG